MVFYGRSFIMTKIIVAVDFMINSFDLFLRTGEGKDLFHLVMVVDTALELNSNVLIIRDNILRLIKEERFLYQNEGLIKEHLMSRDFWYDNLPESFFLEVDIVPKLAIFSYFKSEEGIKILTMVKSVFEKNGYNKSSSEILRWTKKIIDINLVKEGGIDCNLDYFNHRLGTITFWEEAFGDSWEVDSL